MRDTKTRRTEDTKSSAQLNIADGQIRQVVGLEILLAARTVQFADGSEVDPSYRWLVKHTDLAEGHTATEVVAHVLLSE